MKITIIREGPRPFPDLLQGLFANISFNELRQGRHGQAAFDVTVSIDSHGLHAGIATGPEGQPGSWPGSKYFFIPAKIAYIVRNIKTYTPVLSDLKDKTFQFRQLFRLEDEVAVLT